MNLNNIWTSISAIAAAISAGCAVANAIFVKRSYDNKEQTRNTLDKTKENFEENLHLMELARKLGTVENILKLVKSIDENNEKKYVLESYKGIAKQIDEVSMDITKDKEITEHLNAASKMLNYCVENNKYLKELESPVKYDKYELAEELQEVLDKMRIAQNKLAFKA